MSFVSLHPHPLAHRPRSSYQPIKPQDLIEKIAEEYALLVKVDETQSQPYDIVFDEDLYHRLTLCHPSTQEHVIQQVICNWLKTYQYTGSDPEDQLFDIIKQQPQTLQWFAALLTERYLPLRPRGIYANLGIENLFALNRYSERQQQFWAAFKQQHLPAVLAEDPTDFSPHTMQTLHSLVRGSVELNNAFSDMYRQWVYHGTSMNGHAHFMSRWIDMSPQHIMDFAINNYQVSSQVFLARPYYRELALHWYQTNDPHEIMLLMIAENKISARAADYARRKPEFTLSICDMTTLTGSCATPEQMIQRLLDQR